MTPVVVDFLAHNARMWPEKEALVELATGKRRTWSTMIMGGRVLISQRFDAPVT